MGRLALALLALAVLVLAGATTVTAAARPAAPGDPDRDRVDNANELRQGTSPRQRDSDGNRRADGSEDADGDGLSNAAEDASGQDPRDRDTDADGIRDGRENAGAVRSYRAGRLVVELAAGGQLSARIDDHTDIGCGSEAEAESIYVHGPAGEEAPAPDDAEGSADLLEVADNDDEQLDVDEFVDDSDPEFQDDLHDLPDACPQRRLRPGMRVREAALHHGGFDEVELLLAR